MAFIPGLYPMLELKKSHNVDEFRIRTDGLHLVKRIPFEEGHSIESIRQGLANLGNLSASNKWNEYIPISCADLNVHLLHKVFPAHHAILAKKYRVLRAIQKDCDQKYKVPVLKVILQDKTTGAFLFVTGIETMPEEESLPAMTEGWHVFRKDMVAPVGFWEMVRDCL
jgi:hypothetical protein